MVAAQQLLRQARAITLSIRYRRITMASLVSVQGQDVNNDRIIGMFSYGSNNEQQLRARVKSPTLRGRPAYLEGYIRVFGFGAPRWGGGSVASVVPKEGGRVYGCFYTMTPQEVAILDLYENVKEGVYSKEAVVVNVHASAARDQSIEKGQEDANKGASAELSRSDGDNSTRNSSSGGSNNTINIKNDNTEEKFITCSAITYVMSQPYVQSFVQPSPPYLTAVYRTLTASFPDLRDSPIKICDYNGDQRSEWTYPGPRGLPLKAFLVEVGLEERPPWTFPSVLDPMASHLSRAGISTTEDLCKAAAEGVLLARLKSAAATPEPNPSPVEKKALYGMDQPATAPVRLRPTTAPTTAAADSSEISGELPMSTALPDFTQSTVDTINLLASE